MVTSNYLFRSLSGNLNAVATASTILVVDDEASARYALIRIFSTGFRCLEAESVAAAREVLKSEQPDVVLLDYSMPHEDGMVLLRELAGEPFPPSVVMITAHGNERLAVEAMKAGAYDYLAKPYDLDELRLVVSRAIERQELAREVFGLRQLLAREGQFGRMIGSSAKMRELFQTAARVAATDLPLLLLGESGTGKDLLAQEIHMRSGRARGPFLAVNCAALPQNLVESELFGYEKGSFTGATTSREGKFELAHRGTLFLDEIGEMDLAVQPKLLRAVEQGFIERIGGTRRINVDVRVISATNLDLRKAVERSEFREDLYYRLAGVHLELPPLRERREDIVILAGRFWEEVRRKYGRPGPELTHEAIRRLRDAPWPGNVRQLRNVVEQLFVLVAADRVQAQDVDLVLGPAKTQVTPGESGPYTIDDYREARRQFEIEYLTRQLAKHDGNISRTAAAIGIERQTLQEKVRQLGISRMPKTD